jgi:hypothetical protein
LRFDVADGRELGLVVVVAGLLFMAAGLLALTGGLSWFGRLPGDLRLEREGVHVFVPLTSMLLVSLVLSVVVAVIRRLW